MNQRKLTLAIINFIFFTTAVLPVCTFAQESSGAWWNPFASESESSQSIASPEARESTLFTGSSESAFKLPKFELPSWSKGSKKSSSQKQPSTFSRMGKTTKSWWDNTVDFMNPFDKPDAKFTQGYQPQNMQTESDEGLFDWMWPEKETESPTTVNDFLRQPRPRF